jgi:REP element-mobilizing transposase RayT
VGRLPAFSRPEAAQVVLDSWRYLQEQGRMALYGYVVMENHLHLVASAPDLAKEIGDFKSYAARKVIDLLRAHHEQSTLDILGKLRPAYKADREYQFWDEGSHPQMISSPAMMREKLDYIHGNPVRRGYVDDPTHWRYSSARNYAGQKGLIPVVMDW